MPRPLYQQATRVARYIWEHPSNRGGRIRALGRAVAFQARGRLLHQPTCIPLGHRSEFIVHLHWPSASEALYANPPHPNEMAYWQRTLQRGDLFVDVGANVGLYTIWALDCGADVIAVEPDERAVALLRENLRINGYEAGIVRAALADKAGTAEMTRDRSVANYLNLPQGVPWGPAGHLQTVPVTTLDEVLGNRRAAGVKVDVEGAEILVLQGAANALREHRMGTLQLEWNPTSRRTVGQDRRPIAALLRTYGYKLFRPDESGYMAAVSDLEFGCDVFAALDS